MREIKFKAWHPEYGWADWEKITGMLYQSTPFESIENLMQYTGLKDKNGVEIYEGDILDIGDVVREKDDSPEDKFYIEIVWGNDPEIFDGFGWTGKFYYKDAWGVGTFDADDEHRPEYWRNYEVVGNIYENKELIKEER